MILWIIILVQFSSAQSVVSSSLQPHGLQHARLPCSLLSPRSFSNSCLLSQWCHLTISSSTVPFSSCLQSSQHQGLFQWEGSSQQVARVLELQLQHLVLPMNIQDWFPLGLTGLTCLQFKGSSESSPAPQFESINSSALSLLYIQLSHLYVTTGKAIALTRRTFVSKAMSLLFNTCLGLSRSFSSKDKHLLILWL